SAGFFTGHSATAKPRIPGLVFRHYPIRLGLFADTLWVIRADAAHRSLLGSRVVRLGDGTVERAVAAGQPIVQHDNDSQRKDLLPSALVCPEVLGARGVVRDPEHLPIVVATDNGERVETVLTPAPLGSAVTWIEARRPGATPWSDRFP